MPKWPRHPPWWRPRSVRPPSPVVPPWAPTWPAVCLGARLGHPLFPVWRSCLACLRRVVPSPGPGVPVTMLHPGPRLVPPGSWQGKCDLRARLPHPLAFLLGWGHWALGMHGQATVWASVDPCYGSCCSPAPPAFRHGAAGGVGRGKKLTPLKAAAFGVMGCVRNRYTCGCLDWWLRVCRPWALGPDGTRGPRWCRGIGWPLGLAASGGSCFRCRLAGPITCCSPHQGSSHMVALVA